MIIGPDGTAYELTNKGCILGHLLEEFPEIEFNDGVELVGALFSGAEVLAGRKVITDVV